MTEKSISSRASEPDDRALDVGPPPPQTLVVRLTESQIDEFHRFGFTHVNRLTTDEELAWLEPIYDHLFAGRTGSFAGGYFDLARPYDSAGEDLVPQVLAPEARFPALLETTVVRNAIGIAAQLLGLAEADVHSWGHMICKPPKVGGPLPWHQDEGYWDPSKRYRALGCWVPLDPATETSGCMHFIPGSHLGPVREHRHIDDDPAIHGLVAVGVDGAGPDQSPVAVPLLPGGATFHHCRTLHMTTPNVSDRIRRAWANELQVAPEPLPPGEIADRPWIREGAQAWSRRAIVQSG